MSKGYDHETYRWNKSGCHLIPCVYMFCVWEKEAGDYIHETIRGYSAEEISAGIEKIEYKAAYMPVGWSSGPLGFYCQCTTKLLQG